MAKKAPPQEDLDASFSAQMPPKPPRAPRSDKGAKRMPPNAAMVISERLDWVQARLAKLEPEYLSLQHERNGLEAALKAFAEADANQ